ncbi:7466_t:CDS:2, partial [Ambispora leptoticha]
MNDDFGDVSDENCNHPFYPFLRDLAKHLISIREIEVSHEVMDQILKIITEESKSKSPYCKRK